jgi:uncharacterized NAD(P)/FAD-binding protein YdhS
MSFSTALRTFFSHFTSVSETEIESLVEHAVPLFDQARAAITADVQQLVTQGTSDVQALVTAAVADLKAEIAALKAALGQAPAAPAANASFDAVVTPAGDAPSA